MSAEWQAAAIQGAARVIAENAGLLTELDSAIGDGDHGTNMKRGFDAVAAIADELAALSPGAAAQKLGMTLVSKVGGASGPLYGSFFMALGKALGDAPLDLPRLAAAFDEGVAAVKKRGKSEAGEKTMLDVLAPVAEALREAAQQAPTGQGMVTRWADHLSDVARRGLESTRDMKATKGRAAYLGERSVGHLDPGAQSSFLLIHELTGVYEEFGA